MPSKSSQKVDLLTRYDVVNHGGLSVECSSRRENRVTNLGANVITTQGKNSLCNLVLLLNRKVARHRLHGLLLLRTQYNVSVFSKCFNFILPRTIISVTIFDKDTHRLKDNTVIYTEIVYNRSTVYV